MSKALWIAATGMEGQQMLTDTIANNMANVNTNGYKQSRVHFQDMLYQSIKTPSSANASAEALAGIQTGTGVRTVSVAKNFTQGALQVSSSALDVAIEGEGFFEVTLPDGRSAYTRAGNFHLSPSGSVVTADGFPVVGFPSIESDATSIDIAKDGTLATTVAGVTSEKGRIQLARFMNAEGLVSMGGNLYTESEASGTATRGNPSEDGYGAVSQYYLEGSNVQIVKEMVDMIAAQRAYELNSKGVKTADEMLRMAANLK